MYVDGHEALEAFNKVNENIESNLRALLEFWQEQSNICTRAVDQVTEINKALITEEVIRFSAEWKVALPEVKTAIERILKMCDLVMTHAVGAPRNPNARREYYSFQDKDKLVLGGLLVGAAGLIGSWDHVRHSPALQNFGNMLGGLCERLAPIVAPYPEDYQQQQNPPGHLPPPQANSHDTRQGGVISRRQGGTISRQQTHHEQRNYGPINHNFDDWTYVRGF